MPFLALDICRFISLIWDLYTWSTTISKLRPPGERAHRSSSPTRSPTEHPWGTAGEAAKPKRPTSCQGLYCCATNKPPSKQQNEGPSWLIHPGWGPLKMMLVSWTDLKRRGAKILKAWRHDSLSPQILHEVLCAHSPIANTQEMLKLNGSFAGIFLRILILIMCLFSSSLHEASSTKSLTWGQTNPWKFMSSFPLSVSNSQLKTSLTPVTLL